jgi:membrane-bound lytic murein transglycosylase D
MFRLRNFCSCLAFAALAVCFGGPAAAAPAPGAEPAPTLEAAGRLLAQGGEAEPKETERDADLWRRIRKGFALGVLDSPLVAEQEAWYASRPDYIQRFIDRGTRYLYHVVEEVEKRGMPTEIALLPIVESAFNPQAYSRANAAGMWQFIPSTGKVFGLKQDFHADHRRDVLLSTGAAMDYLQKLHGMFDSWELALAAYNCGEGCVARAIQKNARKGLPTDYPSLALPNETRLYVPKLIAIKNIILAPGDYGIDLVPVHNRPYFEKVAAPEKIDFKLAARLAEMNEDEFAALNPASHRPVAATATGAFLVPIEKAAVFRENLELYRALQGPLVSWRVAHAKRGESLEAIAKRHGMSASYLRATGGPFREKKGKLTQPATFMVPSVKDARAIDATLEKKLALKAARGTAAQMQDAAPATPPGLPQGEPGGATGASAATGDHDETPLSTHVVARGDTLFSLARTYETTVEAIRARNGLAHASLRAGQTLLIPGVAMPVSSRVAPAAADAGAERLGRATTHRVRAGDTLYGIARKYGVALADLLRWNRLTPRSVLRPGAKLRLQA